MKYAFIARHRQDYPLSVLCSTLGVSRSGFYDWSTRGTSPRRREDRRLQTQIQALFQEHRRTYGSPRIRLELQALNVRCSRKRVARLMRDAGLQARPRRRFRRTTVSDASHRVAPNLLGRSFRTATPNAVWLADITYLRTREGWLYLAAILDLGSRRIVGWALDSQMPQELTLRALRMALEQRRPPQGMIHHSDRGSQYTCNEYRRLLERHGIQPSMSRKGDCWDNAPMESFFSTLKTELVARRTRWTRREATRAVFEYLEIFYNRRRRHSAIGYLSPEQFEKTHWVPGAHR